MSPIYAVINIDIVKSKALTQRDTFQQKLKDYLFKLNCQLKSSLLAPITFTLGDEFQIVMTQPEKCYELLDAFHAFFSDYHADFYAGIGLGTLSTPISKDTREMDGPCYHRARQALDVTKNKNRFYNMNLHSKLNNIYLVAPNGNIGNGESTSEVAASLDTDELPQTTLTGSMPLILNGLIENNEVLKKKQTMKQKEIIALYEQHGSYNNMIKHAPHLNKSSISQKLNDSHYFLIKHNEQLIEELLHLLCMQLEREASL